MTDPRFYRSSGGQRISALLAATGQAGLWTDGAGDPLVSGAAELEAAGPEDIVFAGSARFAENLAGTRAGAAFVTKALMPSVPAACVGIACEAPQIAFARVCTVLYPDSVAAWPREHDAPPEIGKGVEIGPNAFVARGARIGEGTVIGPGAAIGPGVVIGRNCSIGANCSIEYSILGDRVTLLAGARLGVSGFGYLPHEGRLLPIPQLGRTIIEDDVEIGANSTIDRGALGDTHIGEGSKLGNLVVIAHNCRIGRHCMLVGFTALAGSVTLGDHVVVGGNSGFAGHLTIGEGALVLGGSLVTSHVRQGARVIGAPAMEYDVAARRERAIRKLVQEPPE